MKSRIALVVGVAAAALFLSACSSDSYSSTPAAPGYGNGDSSPTATAPTEPGAASGPAASLTTADSDLGTIVTDGNGMVVYQYDADTQGSGESSCSGQCLAMWPPVPGGDSAPQLTGITGEVTTITGTDGNPQLVLNGWPLYYYAGDSAAGDTTGQGVGGVWWVMTPAGEPVRN